MIKNKLRQYWQALSAREKILAFIVLIIVLPAILIKFAIYPLATLNTNLNLQSTELKNRVVKFLEDYELYTELKQRNISTNFDFEQASTAIFTKSGITTAPEIQVGKTDTFGKTYIIRMPALRTDQIMRLIYNLENNTPPILIEKIETEESIQQTKQSSLTLIVKTE